MKIIPNLSLNKHPVEVPNGSLIDATNIIVSNDNAVIQSEPILDISNITISLDNIIGSNVEYNIIYCIPCNKELIIFVKFKNSPKELFIYRYSEVYNKIKFVTKIDYNNGHLLSEFTYNHDELIIAISEYSDDDSLSVPLKVLNIGTFQNGVNDINNEQLNNKNCHPICPKVIIPNVAINYIFGNAYKGWYYVFIRYKISDSTYTQWFNTNECCFIDNYESSQFFNYWISKDNVAGEQEGKTTQTTANIINSSSKDLSIITFKCDINDLDNNYKHYQLGFICVSKSYTKAYKTSDININETTFEFKSSNVEEYSAAELIKTYYNYFNVKSLTVNNNRLYIGNYKEYNDNSIINLIKNISVKLTWNQSNISSLNFDDIQHDNPMQVSINYLSTNSFSPNQPYNFFIHFVDIYGRCTKGYNLSEFNLQNVGDVYKNNIGNALVYCPDNKFINTFYTATIKLSNLPYGYIGFFVSYEKLERRIKYSVINEKNTRDKNTLDIYSDEFNFADSIDFDFDKIDCIESTVIGPLSNNSTHYYANAYFNKENTIHTYTITNKQLFVADSYNNISKSTHLSLIINNINNDDIASGICRLYNSSYTNYYNNENKVLIPCSPISYTDTVDCNAKTNFISFHHAIKYYENLYYNDAIKVWQQQGETTAILRPFINLIWADNAEVPWESLQYNNTPAVIFFPITGLNTTEENNKSFRVGNIVECKNTIDLYQMKYNNSGESAPKTYDWYNKNIINTNYFPKTIRRSNIIQDESQTIAWRNFEIENYKTISENKGNIVKLISIGYYFIVHTQHSMFLFNATDTIKSEANDIQLASIDIWDIDYKEIITSNLGFAGIQKEYNGISGEFGYIFYDSDSKRIYRYDNNQINYIDDTIVNFIHKLIGYDVYLIDDKQRNRILFKFFKTDVEDIVLSYNYITNTFVSRHLYDFYRGWSTKEHTYIINKKENNKYYNTISVYSNAEYNNVTVNILINTDYYRMKYIEFIKYNISKIISQLFNDYSPVEGMTHHYAGDLLRIYSADCDTGDIDITVDYYKNFNSPMNYTKPYWRLGNWHFNAIRNKLNEYITGNISAENSSRIYGNWFVIKFICYGKQLIEFESIEPQLTDGENI